jgi:IS605 OrfB family transposase
MRLVVALKLVPTKEQGAALNDTLRRANQAANRISRYAWRSRIFGQYALHRAVYSKTRAVTGLSAQVVVRVIAKVSDAYRLDTRCLRHFTSLGAIAFDDRILRYNLRQQSVSIWTTSGRQSIKFLCSATDRQRLNGRRGESDLVRRYSGDWYLYVGVEVPEKPSVPTADVVGVDLGVTNIAADSDGTIYTGAKLNGLRRRHARVRARLQRKGTPSARRRIKRRRLMEMRFATDTNHCISKAIVRTAQGTDRGIALENLRGILDRVTVSRPQRRTLHSWAFNQLRQFIAYKAVLAGVPIVLVDPRNTSRTCPACGHVAAANRKSQACFQCLSCGLAGHADIIAALNIRGKGRAACQPATREGVVSLGQSSTCKPPASAGGC